jgi:hypothetical protein
MKKVLSLSLIALLSLGVLVGFGGNVNAQVDLVSAASITANEAAFAKALGEDGSWIIAATSDMNFNSELVIEGKFHNKGDSSKDVYRKVAPYTQDDDHNLTGRYTITAPQFTVKSPNTKFQGGIFVGDVYVEANGFTNKDAIIVGDVYFANKEYKSSSTIEAGGQVIGDTQVNADVELVTGASITGNPAAFEKDIGEDGSWLVAATNDMKFNKELVIKGKFENRGEVARELALYASDEDHNLTERFTVMAPQFTVKSPNTIFAGGYFVGDVLVESNGFTIENATVVGNVYFASKEYKSSFATKEGGKVLGTTSVK